MKFHIVHRKANGTYKPIRRNGHVCEFQRRKQARQFIRNRPGQFTDPLIVHPNGLKERLRFSESENGD